MTIQPRVCVRDKVFNMLGSYKLLTIRAKELDVLYDPSQHGVLNRYEISMSTRNKAHLNQSKNVEANQMSIKK